MGLKRKILKKSSLKPEEIKEKAKKGVQEFKYEFKKEIKTAIAAASGFLIALVWRDVVTEFVNNISSRTPFKGKLISAIVVTILCVLVVMITSKLIKENKKSKL